jgi:hypothetical protein
MGRILHLLRQEPDEVTADLIANFCREDAVTVECLFPDSISATPVDWDRIIDDIFRYDRVICW